MGRQLGGLAADGGLVFCVGAEAGVLHLFRPSKGAAALASTVAAAAAIATKADGGAKAIAAARAGGGAKASGAKVTDGEAHGKPAAPREAPQAVTSNWAKREGKLQPAGGNYNAALRRLERALGKDEDEWCAVYISAEEMAAGSPLKAARSLKAGEEAAGAGLTEAEAEKAAAAEALKKAKIEKMAEAWSKAQQQTREELGFREIQGGMSEAYDYGGGGGY